MKRTASWLYEPNNVNVIGIDNITNKYSLPTGIDLITSQQTIIQNIKFEILPK